MDTPLTKDLLKDLVKHADELTLEQIKESWELAGVIIDKADSLQKELQSYKDEILSSQATLKDLRAKESALKEQIQELESKKRNASNELAKLNDEISVQKIINQAKKAKLELQESRKQILPGSLKSVQIYLKDGSIAKAKPAQKIFSEDVYKKYRVAFKENRTLKIHISSLELENKRLQIELRDFYSDLALEGMGALESKATQEQQLPLDSKDIIATEEDLSDFKKMLQDHKRKKSKPPKH